MGTVSLRTWEGGQLGRQRKRRGRRRKDEIALRRGALAQELVQQLSNKAAVSHQNMIQVQDKTRQRACLSWRVTSGIR
eukprot:120052-Hanusia_phi.AAC.1